MSTSSFRRDRYTLYAYFNVSAYVWVMYGMGPALLILRDETGMSRTVSSLHSTALAGGVLLAGIFGARIMAALHRSGTMALGGLFTAIGALGFAFGPSASVSVPSALLLGFAGSVTINAQNAFFSVHHGASASAAIGESNGLAIAAGLMSPLAIGVLVGMGWNWRLALVFPVLMLAAGYGLRGRDAGALNVQVEMHDSHVHRLPALYWWAWLASLFCVATEFAFVLWAGDVLRDQAKVSTAVAAGGLSAVAVGMMLSRFTIAPLSRRFPIETLFRISLVIPLAAWLPMWLSTNAPVILAAMFVIGLGLGYHFPVSMTRMLAAAPGLADDAATRSSLSSGIAIGGSPFLLAVLAGAVGLHAAFVMVPVLLVLALAVAVARPVRV